MYCTTCSRDKSPKSFPALMRKPSSILTPICYACSKKQGLDHTWRLYPKKATAWRCRSKYGVTQRDIALLLDVQNHRCPGCHKPLDPSDCIDHDHKSFKVRGILCGKCNSAIGLAKDDPVILERLAQYLKQPPGVILDSEICNGNTGYRIN